MGIPEQTDHRFRRNLSTFQVAAGMGCRIGVDGNATRENLV
jgi:hypothetical protein